MKNPLAIMVALVLVALGGLLYVTGGNWNQWRQWAQLPAENAIAANEGKAGQTTAATDGTDAPAATGTVADTSDGGSAPAQSPLTESQRAQPGTEITAAHEGKPEAAPNEADQSATAGKDVAEAPAQSSPPDQTAGSAPSTQPAGSAPSNEPAASAQAEQPPSSAPDVAAMAGAPGPTDQQTAQSSPAASAGATPTDGDQSGASEKQAGAEPSFDIVRVEEDGTAVIAGRATPSAGVTVHLDTKVLGETKANDRGEWVLVVDDPISPGSHDLSAEASGPDGQPLRSKQVVALALPDRAEERPLIVATEPGEPAKVMQAPERSEPVISPTGGHDLAIASVDYNSRGEMIFAGQAEAGAKVRLYIDNKHIADAQTDSRGNWTLEYMGEIAVGTHQLRADQLSSAGKVERRIELPFERANDAMIAQLLDQRADDAASAKPSSKPADEKQSTSAPEQVARTQPSEQHGSATIGNDGRVLKSNDRLAETEVTGTARAREGEGGPSGTTAGSSQPMQTPTGTGESAVAQGPTQAPSPTQEDGALEQPGSGSAQITGSSEIQSHADAGTQDREQEQQGAGRVVIQPGNNLWRIARVIYGKGVQYTVIYEANKDRIRDPDLIYPGQIFSTPGATPPETISPEEREPMQNSALD
ncbi:LysM peptidoglycan-binding domain-containing protein [Rhodoligotrophos ferricapiens]|uniref:LysM peptidoglycan-binding domain-containing protein n=1 Tax=Rhodoligotrophos ferricapiens TaxID=3069264 RepID=UPI00315C8C95